MGCEVKTANVAAGEMEPAGAAEQGSPAGALPAVRPMGTAFGAAIAGVVATTAGLGDATDPQAVGHAVTAVYIFCWIPFGLAALFMVRFLRVALPRTAPLASAAE